MTVAVACVARLATLSRTAPTGLATNGGNSECFWWSDNASYISLKWSMVACSLDALLWRFSPYVFPQWPADRFVMMGALPVWLWLNTCSPIVVAETLLAEYCLCNRPCFRQRNSWQITISVTDHVYHLCSRLPRRERNSWQITTFVADYALDRETPGRLPPL